MKLASKRADELGVDVRFVHMPGRPSKVVVTNPDEPPPLDKFEIVVDDAGGWWRACEQAGLIELKAGMKFEDFEETLACGLKPSEIEAFCKDTPQRHLVMREIDTTEFFLIEQAEVRFVHTGNATLWHKSRVFNARSESIGMSKQRTTRLSEIAEVQQVEASVCQCGQPLYMAPVERSARCPACNRVVVNQGFVGQGRNQERRDAIRGAAEATQRLGDQLRNPPVRGQTAGQIIHDEIEAAAADGLFPVRPAKAKVNGPDGQTFTFNFDSDGRPIDPMEGFDPLGGGPSS